MLDWEARLTLAREFEGDRRVIAARRREDWLDAKVQEWAFDPPARIAKLVLVNAFGPRGTPREITALIYEVAAREYDLLAK